jgi:hypothetical protein
VLDRPSPPATSTTRINRASDSAFSFIPSILPKSWVPTPATSAGPAAPTEDPVRRSVQTYQTSIITLAEHVVDGMFGVEPWSWATHHHPLNVLHEMTRRAEKAAVELGDLMGIEDPSSGEVVDWWHAQFAKQIDQLASSSGESLWLSELAKKAGKTLRNELQHGYGSRSENWSVVELDDHEAEEEEQRDDGDGWQGLGATFPGNRLAPRVGDIDCGQSLPLVQPSAYLASCDRLMCLGNMLVRSLLLTFWAGDM